VVEQVLSFTICSVKTPTSRSGHFCRHFVANLLGCLHTENCRNRIRIDNY